MEITEIIILAAGDYPTHIIPRSLLDSRNVVCCDGAASTFIANGGMPVAVVGDGDSLNDDIKSHVNFVQITDQEHNDLTKAVLFAHNTLNADHVKIIGATGKREDHTLGNISLLIEYMRMGIDVEMITDNGVFIPCHGNRTFSIDNEWWLPALEHNSLEHNEVSIFNFGCTRLSGTGLDYQLRPFSNWWQGTLNYVNSPSFSINADGDYLVFLSFSFRSF